MEQSRAYEILTENMQKEGCPLCRAVNDSVRQTMKSILYEGMTDRQIRERIRSQRGFCRHHGSMFLEVGDALAHAIVYGDALRAALKDVVADEFDAFEKPKVCYFCEHTQKAEDLYVNAMTLSCQNAEFLENYRKSAPLCLHHLHSVHECIKKKKLGEDLYTAVGQITIDNYQVLLDELDEIQRKNDYRFSHEAWTEGEKTAWKRVVGIIHDAVSLPQKKKGLFGK